MTIILTIPFTRTEGTLLREIATAWHTTPEAIVGAFVADLTASVRSSGSDAQRLAQDWFTQSCIAAMDDQPQRFSERSRPEIEVINAIRALGQQAQALSERVYDEDAWNQIIAQAEAFDRAAGPGLAVGRMVWFEAYDGREMYLVDGIGDEQVHVVHIPIRRGIQADAVDDAGWCLRSVVEKKIYEERAH